MTKTELRIAYLAYKFEMNAIATLDTSDNPYYFTIMDMPNGRKIWEVVNLAVEKSCEEMGI